MSDFVSRLGAELDAAAARQARRRLRWPARRSGQLLLAGGAVVAFAGAGGAATLIAGRGEVGGPPTLTYARLTPEQRAAGLEERTRPVVIGRGRLPGSGWRWQLIAFQTTRGLCVAVDVPAEPYVGGGCGSDRPRDGGAVDWQGWLTRSGRPSPAMVVGAVAPEAGRVTVSRADAGRGAGAGRVTRPATVVRVEDPRVLDAIGVARPFAYWVGETAGRHPRAVVTAVDGAGRRLGRVAVPDGGAGREPFRPREGECELQEPADMPIEERALTLPAPALDGFPLLRRPQRAGDRPAALLRHLRRTTRGPLTGMGAFDPASIRRLPGIEPRYLVATGMRTLTLPPRDCLRSATPGARADERQVERVVRAFPRRAWLAVFDADGRSFGMTDARRLRSGRILVFDPHGGRMTVRGIVPDGVATVTLKPRGAAGQTVAVAGNVFVAELAITAKQLGTVDQVWRDAAGRVVRRWR